MWSFRVRFSSKNNPRNLMLAIPFSSTLSILDIEELGEGYLSEYFYSIMKALIFFVLTDNLFASNYSFIFSNSKLALVKKSINNFI